MDERLVRSMTWVTLLGAGAPKPGDLEAALERAPMLVAADGAANDALRFGHRPDWVIGDLDSLQPEAARTLTGDRLIEVAEQDSTDFEKCLTRIWAPMILATGFTGRRTDHALAVLSALVRHHTRPCVVFDEHDVIFAAPPRIALDLKPGTRVSLFPLTRVTGRSEGLEWPISGFDFAPDGKIGTSNRATGPVELVFHMPGMVVILPRAALDRALAALAPD